MRIATVKIYTLTESEVMRLMIIAMEQLSAPKPDNIKTFTQSALAQLKQEVGS